MEQLQILQPKDRMKTLTGAILHPQTIAPNSHLFFSDGSHKHSDTSYVFITDQAPKSTPSEGESTDIRWAGVSELESMGHDEMVENVREIARYVLTTLLQSWEPVDPEEFKI